MLAHNVYFSLLESSEATRNRLLEACRKYLRAHSGVVLFACGTLATDLVRPVNDRDFDVGLHILFATKEDHDRYQVSAPHLQFVAENKAAWKKVRVFDSIVEQS